AGSRSAGRPRASTRTSPRRRARRRARSRSTSTVCSTACSSRRRRSTRTTRSSCPGSTRSSSRRRAPSARACSAGSSKVGGEDLDIESRRQDAREAAEDSKQRLADTWQLFKDLEPKQIIGDEQLFRELKDRFGSPYGFDVYFTGGMGAEAIRELLRDLDLDAEAASLRETIKTSKGQKQQRAIKRLKVVN